MSEQKNTMWTRIRGNTSRDPILLGRKISPEWLQEQIRLIEFSFDGGATWTSCATEGATADKWVNWQFSTSFEDAGDYRMTVRAKTADGMVSPLAATLLFQVS